MARILKISRRSLLRLTPVLALLPLGLLARRRDPDAGKLRVTVIDVGQGDSTLVETPGGHTLLMDGGGNSDELDADTTDIGLRIVLPYLRYRGIDRLDILALSHPHGDHVGGLAAVLREVQIGAVLDGTTLPYPSPAYTQFRDLLHQKNIPYQRAEQGMRLSFSDGVTATILNPPATVTQYGAQAVYGTGADDATINNYSLLLHLSYGRTSFLVTGDAEIQAEQSVLAAYPNLTVNVLRVGHHGSRNATGNDWLAQLRPEYAAISCGRHNTFGHPHPETLARLAAHNVSYYRTDHNGAIIFLSNGRTVTAHPYLPSS